MTLLAISGPEKAGKTTLCDALLELNPDWIYKHWGKVDSGKEYEVPLRFALSDSKVHLWDRSWLCGSVYATLLDESNQWAKDHWLWEWKYGRALHTRGRGVILLGPSDPRPRSSDDLPIDSRLERIAYDRMSRLYSQWITLRETENLNIPRTRDFLSTLIKLDSGDNKQWPHLPLSEYVGPIAPDTLFVVAQNRSLDDWLPGSDPVYHEFARSLGLYGLLSGWTTANSYNIEVAISVNTSLIVAVDRIATEAVQSYLSTHPDCTAKAIAVSYLAHADYFMKGGFHRDLRSNRT